MRLRIEHLKFRLKCLTTNAFNLRGTGRGKTHKDYTASVESGGSNGQERGTNSYMDS